MNGRIKKVNDSDYTSPSFSAMFCRDGIAKLKECRRGVIISELTMCDLHNLPNLIFLIIVGNIKVMHFAMYVLNYICKGQRLAIGAK